MLNELVQVPNPLGLFVVGHRGDLAFQQTNLGDPLGGDNDLFSILAPLVLNVGIEFLHVKEGAIGTPSAGYQAGAEKRDPHESWA